MRQSMNSICGSIRARTAIWLLATACSAFVAFGAVQEKPAPEGDAPEVAAITDARGEQILNQSCLSCHEIRMIETQAFDTDGWMKEVRMMVEKGSKIDAADVPGFVGYLTRKHGPLPDGAGKKIMLNVCTQCHDLGRILLQPLTRDEWDNTLLSMLNEGAPLSDDDYPVILNYLARNFRPRD